MTTKRLVPRRLAIVILGLLAAALLVASCIALGGSTGPVLHEPLEYSLRPAPAGAIGSSRHLCTARGIAGLVEAVYKGVTAPPYNGCVGFDTYQLYPIRGVSQPMHDRRGQLFFVTRVTEGLFAIVFYGISTNLDATGEGLWVRPPGSEKKQNIGGQNANRGPIRELAQVRKTREPVRVSRRQPRS